MQITDAMVDAAADKLAALDDQFSWLSNKDQNELMRAALSAALSIEQTEPVAWLGRGGIYRDRLFSDRQMAQSWLEDCDGYGTGRAIVPLYAHPPVSALVNAQADADVVERWQPIETAPKDGTRILLVGGVYHGIPFAGYWDFSPYSPDSPWTTVVGRHSLYEHCPTHWMPLLAPPALRSSGSAEVGSATGTKGQADE